MKNPTFPDPRHALIPRRLGRWMRDRFLPPSRIGSEPAGSGTIFARQAS